MHQHVGILAVNGLPVSLPQPFRPEHANAVGGQFNQPSLAEFAERAAQRFAGPQVGRLLWAGLTVDIQ
jgi:hypothetical protein